MATTVRSSISIPTDLKARMDAYGEGVNWSAVACKAIENELAAIITRRKARDMEDVILRLRASKRRTDAAEARAGFQAGERWARESAEYMDLCRLRDAVEEMYREAEGEQEPGLPFDEFCRRVWDDFSMVEAGEDGMTMFLYRKMRPDGPPDRGAGEAFWDAVAGSTSGPEREMANGAPYLSSFYAGAMNVFGQVESKL